ncbi:hypothetical protein ACOME3_007256 [Neoechinorhynchus agilis]
MGSIIGGFTSFLGSCLGTAACNVACSCCRYFYQSTSTRLMYVSILLMSSLVQCIFLIPQLSSYLTHIPRLCPFDEGNSSSFVKCHEIVGYLGVYKLVFAYSLFCMLMIIVTIGVNKSSDFRAKIHNGIWILKLTLYALFIVGAFATPTNKAFLTWMRIFGMTGSLTFVLVQLVLMVDFTCALTELMLEKREQVEDEGGSCT